jgi:hypothetical protein
MLVILHGDNSEGPAKFPGLALLGFELRTLHGQVLYHLNHASSPFCSGYFGDRVSLFAQAGLDLDPPVFHFLL